MALQTLTIRRPDDWHVHLRDGEMLDRVAPHTARQFARAIVMPNLVPPVTRIAEEFGTAAYVLDEDDFREVGRIMCDALGSAPDAESLRARVAALCARRPLYPGLGAFPTFGREDA